MRLPTPESGDRALISAASLVWGPAVAKLMLSEACLARPIAPVRPITRAVETVVPIRITHRGVRRQPRRQRFEVDLSQFTYALIGDVGDSLSLLGERRRREHRELGVEFIYASRGGASPRASSQRKVMMGEAVMTSRPCPKVAESQCASLFIESLGRYLDSWGRTNVMQRLSTENSKGDSVAYA